MIGYVKHFDGNKTMSFKGSDNKLLKKYNKIWEKVGNLLNLEFDSEPVYGDVDKYIKTKIYGNRMAMYGDRVNANFQSKKLYSGNSPYLFFAISVTFIIILCSV